MEEERFFPLPGEAILRILPKSLVLDLSVCLLCLAGCFPHSGHAFPGACLSFFCSFLAAKSVTLSGHTKS